MKLLLILGDDETQERVASHVRPLGFELIRYTHVLKAMDNIDEIDPRAIIISARDFPRHWKIITRFVRDERDKDACPIIILRGKDFPVEDASKASFLGVNGIIAETLEDSAEINRLQEILGRCIPAGEKRKFRRFYTEPWQRFGFVFIHPGSYALITGAVKNISPGGLSFLPDRPPLLNDIAPDTELKDCSLRAGDSILSPVCRINKMGRIVSLEFFSFPEGEREALNKHLQSLPLKELEKLRQTDITP
ncbi:MAG: PilZ domain-containing protein [Treponema sp.]|nr:PilZ domain-containing protein [Treponema sp.]